MKSMLHLMDPVYAGLRPSGDYDPHAAVDATQVAIMAVADPFSPDDCTPGHVREAAFDSLRKNATHYTSPIGDPDLRVEIAKKVARVNGLVIDPDRNVTVAGGADGLLIYSMRPFLEPGARNEVLTPTPSFCTNFEIAQLAGGVTVPVPTYPEDGYELRIEEFEKRLTSKTKVVLITNPNTPTSTVCSRSSLERLAQFVRDNDLVLISDQSFEDTVFDGFQMTNIAAMPGMAERTLLICSVSKGMALCGYRVGYVVASEEITAVLHACAPHCLGAPNTAAQAAVTAAMREPQFMESYRHEYMARAKAVTAMLDKVPKIRYTKPQSGFFLWIDVSAYGGAKKAIRYLVEEAAVLPTDGSMFGSDQHIRLVYAAFAERERCLAAVGRLVDALCRHPVNG